MTSVVKVKKTADEMDKVDGVSYETQPGLAGETRWAVAEGHTWIWDARFQYWAMWS